MDSIHLAVDQGQDEQMDRVAGVYYSFCAFDGLPLLCAKFPQVHVMNTQGSGEADLLSAVSHVAIVAICQKTSVPAS